jgi:hypothetical protein
VVATLDRLSDDVVDRSLIIAHLLAAGVQGLYTARDGRIDPLPIIRSLQDVIRRLLVDVEQARVTVAELEDAQEALKRNLSESRDALQRRTVEIQALGRQSSPLSVSLLSAIRLCGRSVNAIAKAAQVPQPVLHRFVKGERGISLKTADKVFAVLGGYLPPVTAADSLDSS